MELSEAAREYLKNRLGHIRRELGVWENNKQNRMSALRLKVRKVREANDNIKKYKQLVKDLSALVESPDWEV